MILLSHKFKTVGFLCLIPSILIFILKIILKFDLKFLYIPVFAIQSTFIETKYFFWMHSDISDELSAFSLIIGMTIIALSKEKEEEVDYDQLRLKAFSLGLIVNAIYLIFGLGFFYGFSAIYILSINLFSFLLFYIVIFRILIFRWRKSIPINKLVQNGLDN